MKKGLLVLTALVAFVFALPLNADAKIEITGAALVSAQDVDFDSTSGVLDEDFNFNDPRVNLYVNGEVSDKISVTTKFWVANDWSHENQRSNGGATSIGAPNEGTALQSALAGSSVAFLRGYVTLKDVMGSGFDLKAGTIDIPYGWEYGTRTNNGDDMKNDFITNSLLDINGGDEGISVSGSFDMGQTSTPLAWEIALLNGGVVGDGQPSGNPNGGTAGASNQSKANDDLSWAIRAEVGLMENLTMQASYYTNDQRKDGDRDPLNIGSSLLVNAVSNPGGVAHLNPNLVGLVYTGDADGGAVDRDMWEVSGKYDYGQGYLMAFWGNIDADTATTGNSRQWDYMGAQGRYNFDENSYLAVRWNRLDPDYAASGNLGQPTLWTVAAGYKLADNAMVKAEWSSFDEGGSGFGNAAGGIGGAPNTADARSQDADALTVALGVSF